MDVSFLFESKFVALPILCNTSSTETLSESISQSTLIITILNMKPILITTEDCWCFWIARYSTSGLVTH